MSGRLDSNYIQINRADPVALRAECFWVVSLALESLVLPPRFLYDLGTTLIFYVFYSLLHGLIGSLPGTETGYPKTDSSTGA